MIRKALLGAAILAMTPLVVPVTARAAADKPAAEKAAPTKTVLEIEGMVCADCAAKVKAKLDKTEGVLKYEVSAKEGVAEVSYDPGKISPDQIAAAVTETGFKARVKGEKKG